VIRYQVWTGPSTDATRQLVLVGVTRATSAAQAQERLDAAHPGCMVYLEG
jgi:hypothetical protein